MIVEDLKNSGFFVKPVIGQKGEKEMSLDVYLTVENKQKKNTDKVVPVRMDGQTKMITLDEWYKLHPGVEPCMPEQEDETNGVYWANITHNLGKMAKEANLHYPLWRPEEINITKAVQLIGPLAIGLEKLLSEPETFKQYNASNDWGTYENLVEFVKGYLAACIEYPDATVSVWR